ncbi:MAG: carboxypeptidase-like regulatory domain-containing protein [Chloroflexia bacterium]|nr:carboxypeptidase-like regulatory domain-containing protein [Chloroflexia bacterium]
MEYVNIWVENEEKGTTSALDGTFSFDQNVQSQTLIFSAIGYESKSVMVLSNNSPCPVYFSL